MLTSERIKDAKTWLISVKRHARSRGHVQGVSMVYLIRSTFLFWVCSCEDPTHAGDNIWCPKHGFMPLLIRSLILVALIWIFALLFFPQGV